MRFLGSALNLWLRKETILNKYDDEYTSIDNENDNREWCVPEMCNLVLSDAGCGLVDADGLLEDWLLHVGVEIDLHV